ncbi:cytochrome P450 [Saccharothrix australiensis]|uniref:Cytochrome P450 n=1 Tax=Saccharothrix australiensis TaxID=2072 RepID=A0A495W196_9PSEU|nr:cytochrome P450 [Saccharothrix australiensis]RKT53648.1 cytochrome P450 [Saccharothrix australiensis]
MTETTSSMPLADPGTMGPPQDHARLRAHCPITRVQLPIGVSAWYVTRYEDVRALLGDPRFTRPDITIFPHPTGERPRDVGLTTMMEMPEPAHAKLRRAIAEPFGTRAVQARTDRIRRIADRVLDDFTAANRGRGDLVLGFVEPFPLAVMCDVVGIPYEDRDRFLAPADAALGALSTLEESRRVTGFLRAYVLEVAERKRREPGQDVLTDLVRRWDAGELSREDVVDFGLSMLIAGYRTVTMFLANALVVLLTEPDRLADLRRDRGVMDTAVDELLRYLPVMNSNIVLLAEQDVEVCGQLVRAGEIVLPVIASANRDERAFPGADRLDLRRRPNPHVVFGRGPHSCVGANLARAELAVGLSALLDRFPHLALAVDPTDLSWEDDLPVKSPRRLPVTWRERGTG